MVANVNANRSTGVSRRNRIVRHPLVAAVEEAAHLRKIADEGESPETLPILVGAALTFVVALALLVFLLVFGIAHFA